MPFPLTPAIIADALTDITPDILEEKGIRLLMLDFDNTIVPYTTSIPEPLMEQWLLDMKQTDIQLCVVSNSKKDRVKLFCENYAIPCITHAKKPFTKGIRECLAKFGIPAFFNDTVTAEIYTDTLGGNLSGITPILVKAIDNHNFWLKARHVLELPFIYAARKRRINHEES